MCEKGGLGCGFNICVNKDGTALTAKPGTTPAQDSAPGVKTPAKTEFPKTTTTTRKNTKTNNAHN